MKQRYAMTVAVKGLAVRGRGGIVFHDNAIAFGRCIDEDEAILCQMNS